MVDLARPLVVLVSLDFLVHSPGHPYAKLVSFALCLLAASLTTRLDLLVAAQSAWIAVSVFDLFKPYTPPPPSPTEEEKRAGDEKIESAKGCPPALRAIADASYVLAEKNLDGPETCDGKEWKVLIADADRPESERITVECASYPGLSIKRWRVKTRVFGTLTGIADETFDYDKRCPPQGWDVAVMRGETVTLFDDEEAGYGVAVYATAPAAGGAISSRELVDVRWVNMDSPKNGLSLTNVSIPSKIDHFGSFIVPKGDKNLVRAFSHPGGGARLKPVDDSIDQETPQWYEFTLVSNIELNGWLMTSLVNSATSDALYGSTKALKKHLASKWPPITS